jgi:hypothetical protein
MQPESSDGFASVGTILPKEEAALLPGGLFAFKPYFLPARAGAMPVPQWNRFSGNWRLYMICAQPFADSKKVGQRIRLATFSRGLACMIFWQDSSSSRL